MNMTFIWLNRYGMREILFGWDEKKNREAEEDEEEGIFFGFNGAKWINKEEEMKWKEAVMYE